MIYTLYFTHAILLTLYYTCYTTHVVLYILYDIHAVLYTCYTTHVVLYMLYDIHAVLYTCYTTHVVLYILYDIHAVLHILYYSRCTLHILYDIHTVFYMLYHSAHCTSVCANYMCIYTYTCMYCAAGRMRTVYCVNLTITCVLKGCNNYFNVLPYIYYSIYILRYKQYGI